MLIAHEKARQRRHGKEGIVVFATALVVSNYVSEGEMQRANLTPLVFVVE